MRYVALLRGINVGGHRSIRMVDLKSMFEAAGATNVATYIQSGNVVFDHVSRAPAPLLEAAVRKATKLDVSIIVRTARELAVVVANNPFTDGTDHLHVMFLPAKQTIELKGSPDESHKIVGRELYMHLPGGVGRSKLAASASKLNGTMRNWRTISALLAMTSTTTG